MRANLLGFRVKAYIKLVLADILNLILLIAEDSLLIELKLRS